MRIAFYANCAVSIIDGFQALVLVGSCQQQLQMDDPAVPGSANFRDPAHV